MNKYEPCMARRTKMPADKKEQKNVLPENSKFGLVFIVYCLENVSCRAA